MFAPERKFVSMSGSMIRSAKFLYPLKCGTPISDHWFPLCHSSVQFGLLRCTGICSQYSDFFLVFHRCTLDTPWYGLVHELLCNTSIHCKLRSTPQHVRLLLPIDNARVIFDQLMSVIFTYFLTFYHMTSEIFYTIQRFDSFVSHVL